MKYAKILAAVFAALFFLSGCATTTATPRSAIAEACAKTHSADSLARARCECDAKFPVASISEVEAQRGICYQCAAEYPDSPQARELCEREKNRERINTDAFAELFLMLVLVGALALTI
jgi:hypothetical protein